MSAQLRATYAAIHAAIATLFRIPSAAVALAVALALASCREAPVSGAAPADPADPGAPAPRVGYRSTIGPYARQRPVSPGPSSPAAWRDQNERAAPAPKSGQDKSGQDKSGQ
jgi:hypothetical protein